MFVPINATFEENDEKLSEAADNAIDVLEGYDKLRWILALILLTVEIVSNYLCLRIIHFEHFGEDPQKRHILNRLHSMLASAMMTWNFTLANVVILRLAWGTLPQSLVKFLFVIPKSILLMIILMILNQMIFIKALAICYWKNIPPINDELFDRLLKMVNVLLAVYLSILSNMGHNVEQSLVLFLCGVQDKNGDGNLPVFRYTFHRATNFF